jgi:hypothetical protein
MTSFAKEFAMQRKSTVLVALLAVLSIATGVAVAQQAAPKGEPAAIPKGHEQFFKELSVLAKKHPEAAARFRLVDPKGKPDTPTPKAGSFHACCEWTLSTPRKCTQECLE